MPKFYFHVRKGGVLERDRIGAELPSVTIAYEEAVGAAREILAEKVRLGEVIDGESFVISNEQGSVVGELPFRSVLRFD
ncbi:hypothetical protein [Rhizobium sp. LC145]|uniref:DUF6894 family protein n=1 Tax=Rhizobium sp. LC145 TaxID=1120688 RepID=UPI00062A4ABF|nr:hypothetical protein [Rhizobium sp. LC145]KKX25339.1 hypothetical protein YH62_25700 [Rhizobium sp. LC145]TKT45365.1 hypothetical protein FDR95_25865 [Rhizobiaceae bacterium LC148]